MMEFSVITAWRVNGFAEFLDVHNRLVPPDPRKYTALSCSRSDSALRSIWTAVRGQHMIDYAWDSQNKSIFHRQSQYDGDMTCVCSGQATFRTRFFGFPVDDPLARALPIYRPLLSCP
ncbi:hypothetical protein TNCV_4171511 [Trichonephila clavipes]|nr:hypothetical protein TNCV_4171511 [Trichonephila clavipes]